MDFMWAMHKFRNDLSIRNYGSRSLKTYRCVGECDNHEERPPQVSQHPRRPGLGGKILLYDLLGRKEGRRQMSGIPWRGKKCVEKTASVVVGHADVWWSSMHAL